MAINDETPSPCPKCSSQRVWAESGGYTTVKPPGFLAGASTMWALVCPNCGYTEFYAKNLEMFKPKDKKAS